MTSVVKQILSGAAGVSFLLLAVYLGYLAIAWLLLGIMGMLSMILLFFGLAMVLQAVVCVLCVESLVQMGQALLVGPTRCQGILVCVGVSIAQMWRHVLFRNSVTVMGLTFLALVVAYRYPNLAPNGKEAELWRTVFSISNINVMLPWEVAGALVTFGFVDGLASRKV